MNERILRLCPDRVTLSPPDFGYPARHPAKIGDIQKKERGGLTADFIRSEFGFRVCPKHHSTPVSGPSFKLAFSTAAALKFASSNRVKVAWSALNVPKILRNELSIESSYRQKEMGNKEKWKGGRPVKDASIKRSNVVQTKLTEAERAILEVKVVEAGLSKYEYMRQAILSGEIVPPCPRISPEQWDVLKNLVVELHNIGINVNIIAKKANNDLGRDYVSDLKRFLQAFENIKNKYINKLI